MNIFRLPFILILLSVLLCNCKKKNEPVPRGEEPTYTCEDHKDYYDNPNFTGSFYTVKTVYDKSGNVVTRQGDAFSYVDNAINVKTDPAAFSYQVTLSSGLATKIINDENKYKELFYDSDKHINVVKIHFYTSVDTYNLAYKNGNLVSITKKVESNGIQEQYIITYLPDMMNALLADNTDAIYNILGDYIPPKYLGKLSVNAVSNVTITYKSSGAITEDYRDYTYLKNGESIKVSEVTTGADNLQNTSGPLVPNPNKQTATYYQLSKDCPQ